MHTLQAHQVWLVGCAHGDLYLTRHPLKKKSWLPFCQLANEDARPAGIQAAARRGAAFSLGFGAGCGAQTPVKGLINHVAVSTGSLATTGRRGRRAPRRQPPTAACAALPWPVAGRRREPRAPGAEPTRDSRDGGGCERGGTPAHRRGRASSSSSWILSSLKCSRLCPSRHQMGKYVESTRQIDSDEPRHVKGTKWVNYKEILLLNTVHRVS